MAIMPHALTDRIVAGYTTPMERYDGVVLHVAVSESAYPSYAPGTVAHFYVRKDGTICQQIDTRYRAGTAYMGNRRLIGVETQGGLRSPNSEPWTDAQLDALARLCAWAHATHGIPLTAMPNSLPTSRGIGPHRLGIDGNFSHVHPGRVAGGEVWSRSLGKICPGDVKIAQIPEIITRARAIAGEAANVTPTPKPQPAPKPKPTAKEVTVKANLQILDLRNAHKRAITSADVGRLQALLLAHGYGPAGLVGKNGRPDRLAGPATKKIVGQFQAKYNTGDGKGHADYIVGEGTWSALLEK